MNPLPFSTHKMVLPVDGLKKYILSDLWTLYALMFSELRHHTSSRFEFLHPMKGMCWTKYGFLVLQILIQILLQKIPQIAMIIHMRKCMECFNLTCPSITIEPFSLHHLWVGIYLSSSYSFIIFNIHSLMQVS